jgi:hypothetical protein
MSRTFTLRWLFICVTAVCVCLAFATWFPLLARMIFWHFAPALAASVGMSLLSSRRLAAFAVSAVASFLGAIIGAALFTNTFSELAKDTDERVTTLEWYWTENGMPIQACALAAAILAGGFWLQFVRREKPRRPSQHE